MESIVVDRERLANVLLISFVLELKGLLEKVYGHVFLYYYRSTQTNGAIHGEKTMNVGSDGTRRMISLLSI